MAITIFGVPGGDFDGDGFFGVEVKARDLLLDRNVLLLTSE